MPPERVFSIAARALKNRLFPSDRVCTTAMTRKNRLDWKVKSSSQRLNFSLYTAHYPSSLQSASLIVLGRFTVSIPSLPHQLWVSPLAAAMCASTPTAPVEAVEIGGKEWWRAQYKQRRHGYSAPLGTADYRPCCLQASVTTTLVLRTTSRFVMPYLIGSTTLLYVCTVHPAARRV